MSKGKLKYVVYWNKCDTRLPEWKAIPKWQSCESLEKARKLKNNLESQDGFRSNIYIAEKIE